MSKSIQLRDTHQTTVLVVEDDYVALQVFYGPMDAADPDLSDAVMIYELHESIDLVHALIQGGAYQAGSKVDFFSCMRGECGEDCPWRPGCRKRGTSSDR